MASQHFLIIGNGVAGTEAALTIRRRLATDAAAITLISDESPYFFSRTALMYAFMDRLQRRDLEPFERSMYDRQHIDRRHARVIDINAHAKTITLKDGATLSYDRLLLATGAAPRMIPFPGLEAVQEGLVHFVSLQDLDEAERLVPSTRQAVVVGGGLIGVELAECLHHHGLEVTFLVREPYFWPAALGEEEGTMITDHIKAQGINIVHDEELQQIHVNTQGRIASIQTSTHRHIPCQMLGICIGVTPAINWLADVQTPPKTNQGLIVNRAFQTSLPDVFGAGDCTEITDPDGSSFRETIWYSARDQGRLAARSMLGDSIHYEPPIFYNSSKFFHIEYTTVGQVNDLPPGAGSLFRKHPDKKISQRILVNAHRQVIGFSMLGSRWDHRRLIDWIEERRSLDFVKAHLHQAQFDHEFGRADLRIMQEKETFR